MGAIINSTRSVRQVSKEQSDQNWDKVFGKTKMEQWLESKDEEECKRCNSTGFYTDKETGFNMICDCEKDAKED